MDHCLAICAANSERRRIAHPVCLAHAQGLLRHALSIVEQLSCDGWCSVPLQAMKALPFIRARSVALKLSRKYGVPTAALHAAANRIRKGWRVSPAGCLYRTGSIRRLSTVLACAECAVDPNYVSQSLQ